MRRRHVPVVLIAGLLSLTALAEPAHACVGPPSCVSGLFGTKGLEPSLPSSIVGLPTHRAEQGDFVLRNASGTEIETTLEEDGDLQFLATGVLEAGTYTVTSADGCGATNGDETVTFNIVDAVPAPSVSGSAAVAAAKRGKLWFPSSNVQTSCAHAVDAASVTLVVTPDRLLAPYLPVAVWETWVDGKVWSRVLPVRPASTPSFPSSTWDPLKVRLYTACDGLDHGTYDGLTPGTHDVEVRARLAGGAPIEPTRIRVRVSCGDKNGEVVDAEGPLETEPVVSNPFGNPNCDSDDAGMKPTTTSDGCDCSTSPASGRRATASVGMALRAVALLRARTKKRGV